MILTGNEDLRVKKTITGIKTAFEALICEKEYDRIYRNHGTCTNDKKLLDNVLECCNLILAKEDDQCPVEMYGRTLYAARSAVDGIRIDGKEGNIIYAPEKRK